MTKIGIYDSGIGGLTTLAKLIIQFPHCDFLYYSDNANFPLGTLSSDKLERATSKAIAYLKKSCDCVVLACNTASSHTSDKSVFKLLPPLNEFLPKSTLVLGTPNTLKKLNVKTQGFQTIDTEDLASLVTDLFSPLPSRETEILEKIEELLLPQIKNIKFDNVILACSHYVLIEDTIKEMCQKAELFDGNNRLIDELKKVIKPLSQIGDVDFVFSGQTQIEQYVVILEKLLSFYHKMPN